MGSAKDIFFEEEVLPSNTKVIQKDEDGAYIELLKKLQNKEVKLSYSSLKAFAQSPREFINYKLKPKTPPNEGMVFGSLCDYYLTTPEADFNEQFVIIDKAPTSDNQKAFCVDMFAGKTKEEAFELNYKRGSAEDTYNSMKEYIEGHLSGKTICTTSQIEDAKKVVANLKKSELVMQYVDACTDFQYKVEWEHEGFKFRGALDGKGEGIIVDFKFDGKGGADPDKFERSIRDRKIYMQLGMYADQFEELPECYLIAFNKTGAFTVIKVDYTFIMYGIREYKHLVNKFNQCIKENRWQESFNFWDHSSGVRTAFKPAWVKGFDTEIEEI